LRNKNEGDKIRVIAMGAHPDDMVIEAGGTLAKLAAESYNDVYILTLTKGNYTGVDDTYYDEETIIKELKEGARRLGIYKLVVLKNSTAKLKATFEVINEVDSVIDLIKPDLLISLHQFDSHQDHKAAGEIALAVSRQGRVKNIIVPVTSPYRPTAYSYHPQFFVDISNTLTQKIDAIKAHQSQYKKYGGEQLVDRVVGTAKYFGWYHGYKFAEAFEIIRMDGNLIF
jgi:LmbE family N-acetylglucosaminyl deacetylase